MPGGQLGEELLPLTPLKASFLLDPEARLVSHLGTLNWVQGWAEPCRSGPHTLQTPRCLHPQVLRVKRLAPWRWLWLNGECPLEERGCSGPPLIPEARLPPLSLEGPHQGARLCGCQDQRAARARPAPASDSAARLQWTVCAGGLRGALPAADGHPCAGIRAQGPGNTPSSSERLHQAPPSSGRLGSFELLCARPR